MKSVSKPAQECAVEIAKGLKNCARLAQLEIDEINIGSRIHAILMHCTKLSSLAIRGRRIEGSLKPIWRSLGATLIRLHIGCYYSDLGKKRRDVISIPDLVRHRVNLHRVDVFNLDRAITSDLVALGSRIRVLAVKRPSNSNLACWRKMYEACTNLEVAHLVLDSDSTKAVNVLSLMLARLVSLVLDGLGRPMPDEDRFFSVLSTCSVLEEDEFCIQVSAPEGLLRELFESLKSVTTLTCLMGGGVISNPKRTSSMA